MKTVFVSEAQRLIARASPKSAMMIAATKYDRYRIGEAWQRFESSAWQHSTTVAEVQHFGRHTTATGETIAVQALATREIACQVQIMEIMMARYEDLTDGDLEELGYTRAEFDAEWGRVFQNGRCWFMRVVVTEPSALQQ